MQEDLSRGIDIFADQSVRESYIAADTLLWCGKYVGWRSQNVYWLGASGKDDTVMSASFSQLAEFHKTPEQFETDFEKHTFYWPCRFSDQMCSWIDLSAYTQHKDLHPLDIYSSRLRFLNHFQAVADTTGKAVEIYYSSIGLRDINRFMFEVRPGETLNTRFQRILLARQQILAVLTGETEQTDRCITSEYDELPFLPSVSRIYTVGSLGFNYILAMDINLVVIFQSERKYVLTPIDMPFRSFHSQFATVRAFDRQQLEDRLGMKGMIPRMKPIEGFMSAQKTQQIAELSRVFGVGLTIMAMSEEDWVEKKTNVYKNAYITNASEQVSLVYCDQQIGGHL